MKQRGCNTLTINRRLQDSDMLRKEKHISFSFVCTGTRKQPT